jgi:hypothetical protein
MHEAQHSAADSGARRPGGVGGVAFGVQGDSISGRDASSAGAAGSAVQAPQVRHIGLECT